MSIPEGQYSEEEIRKAARDQELIRQKLLEIMDLQAGIDSMIRDERKTPFGSGKFRNARPEKLQRVVLMTAIQFVAYEPENMVAGNDKFKESADEMISIVLEQLRWIDEKYQ